eukprot:TRINITY_DN1177_c0_g2_i1.p1 TRINITY_DN1177_c0_g2~~TRINITY_DN1177_c0_g2_i1.p1  ORF type:complete len:642 (-),score=75.43 TRINITY_DN1177_c0_g2_i1:619-2442(-)
MSGSWHPTNLQLPSWSSSLEDKAYEGLHMQLQQAMPTPQMEALMGFSLHTTNGSNSVGNYVDHGRSLGPPSEPTQAFCAQIRSASADLDPHEVPSIIPLGNTASWRRTPSNGWEGKMEGANVLLPMRQQGNMSERDFELSTTEAAIEGLLNGTLRGWKPKDSHIDGRTSRLLPLEGAIAASKVLQGGKQFASQPNETPHLDGSRADFQVLLRGLSAEEEACFASLDVHATVSTKKSKSFDTRILDRQRFPTRVEGLEANTAPSESLFNLTSLQGLEHSARATFSGVSSPSKRSRDNWQAAAGPGFPGVTALTRAFSIPASAGKHSAEDLFSLPFSFNGRGLTFPNSNSYPQDGPTHAVAPAPLSFRKRQSSFPNLRNPQGDATRPQSLTEDKHGFPSRHHNSSFLPNDLEAMQKGSVTGDIPFIEGPEEMVDVDGETEVGELVPKNALGAVTQDNEGGCPHKVKQGEVENGELAVGLVGSGPFLDAKAVADALRSPAGRGKRNKAKEEEALDEWHWRKYGQKKIKDSPTYRSYYHCGARLALKCAAKRHVDRLNDDHSVTAILYSAEHCHNPPVRHYTVDRWQMLRVSSVEGASNESLPLVPTIGDT